MTIEATLLIRAASGVVFFGVGIILAWAARRARDRFGANLALAAACAAFGSSFIAVNLLLVSPATALVGIALQALFALVAFVAVLWFVARGWLRMHMRWSDLGIALVALAAGVGFSTPEYAKTLFLAQVFRPDLYQGATVVMWRVDGFVMLALLGAFTLLAVAAARAHRASVDLRERKGLEWIALGFFAYPAFMAGVTLAFAANDLTLSRDAVPIVLLVVIAVLAWLRTAPLVALGILGITLLGQLSPVSGIYAVGVGVLRILAAALVALALLRYGLAGADLHRPAARRGSLAAAALATVFIVAQIAQEFFAAEYGLLMGGVVAGTLLFVANPVQRTMERLAGHDGAEPRAAQAPAASQGDPSHREQVFRNALEIALRDRRLTRTEEIGLHRLAEELGIGAGRAHAILVEIEARSLVPE